MSKHTPEKWIKLGGTANIACVKPTGEYPDQKRCGKTGSFSFVGRVYCEIHAKERMVRDAAPELLEALKLFCNVNPNDLHINEVCRRHDVARAAIAKAEGR